MPAFIQIIEWSTSRLDEVMELGRSRRDEMAEDGPVRLTVTAERDKPGRFLTIVEFPSYEAAMRNSHDPKTDEFARTMAELCDGPPVFHDLDVVDTMIRTTGAEQRQKV